MSGPEIDHVVAHAKALKHRWWAPFPWLPDSAKPGRALADSDRIWEHFAHADFEGASVVDFGCHEGYHTFRAIRAGAKSALGIDKSERCISVASVIEDHVEKSGADFWLLTSLDPVPVSDVVLSLSVWHQIDPTYERLADHVTECQSKAKRCVYLDLIDPALEGERDPSPVVESFGGDRLWHRKHPVRRMRSLYRLPGKAR